ncbi:MAG: hypothetical protein JHC26_09055 [Thermofilum sp.]|jgi:replicative DNA helicase|uniref:hypothetical protein n=1 Tax=Thermofilum sp. TaxID=1961369 RepID=UPI00258FF7D6|nr:hypothetical protein [Thermofilum sp.]MCI4409227.1 hypothetical protein [Thermofilum sp.]
MSSQNPLDVYQSVIDQLNQVMNTYNSLLDDQSDKSAFDNTFNTGGQNTQPTIPTLNDVLNTVANNDSVTRVVNQANTTEQLINTFNSTAQASANKTSQLVSNAKATIVKATTVAKTPKTIPSDVYQLVYELTGMTVGTLEAWLQNAEFNDVTSHLPTLVSLLDKLINMLGNYNNGGQNESAQ